MMSSVAVCLAVSHSGLISRTEFREAGDWRIPGRHEESAHDSFHVSCLRLDRIILHYDTVNITKGLLGLHIELKVLHSLRSWALWRRPSVQRQTAAYRSTCWQWATASRRREKVTRCHTAQSYRSSSWSSPWPARCAQSPWWRTPPTAGQGRSVWVCGVTPLETSRQSLLFTITAIINTDSNDGDNTMVVLNLNEKRCDVLCCVCLFNVCTVCLLLECVNSSVVRGMKVFWFWLSLNELNKNIKEVNCRPIAHNNIQVKY